MAKDDGAELSQYLQRQTCFRPQASQDLNRRSLLLSVRPKAGGVHEDISVNEPRHT